MDTVPESLTGWFTKPLCFARRSSILRGVAFFVGVQVTLTYYNFDPALLGPAWAFLKCATFTKFFNTLTNELKLLKQGIDLNQ